MTAPFDDDEPRRPGWRRPAVIAAVAVLVAVVLVVGGVVLGRGTGGNTAAPVRFATASISPAATALPPATAATVSAGPSAPATAADVCPAGLVTSVLPAQAPADTVWHVTAVAPVPVSKAYGPYWTTSTGLPRCFSHSPMGAVIAVVTIDAWLFGTQWETVLATEVARTPGYAAFVTALKADPPDGSADSDVLAGFTVLAYSPTVATVELIYRGAGSGLAGCVVTAQWSGTDWQLATRPDGTITPLSCPSAEAGTYIPWGPEE